MTAYTVSFGLLTVAGVGYFLSHQPVGAVMPEKAAITEQVSVPAVHNQSAPDAPVVAKITDKPEIEPLGREIFEPTPKVLGDLTMRDGTVYKNCRLISHDDGCITILHEDGGGKVPLCNLPEAIQKQFGYDPEEADRAMKVIEDADKAQALAVARGQTAASISQAKQRMPLPDAEGSKDVPLSQDQATAIRNQIETLQDRLGSLQKQESAAQEQDRAFFNAHTYVNTGHIEHEYTNGGGGQTTVDVGPQIEDLQSQIAILQAQLNGVAAR